MVTSLPTQLSKIWHAGMRKQTGRLFLIGCVFLATLSLGVSLGSTRASGVDPSKLAEAHILTNFELRSVTPMRLQIVVGLWLVTYAPDSNPQVTKELLSPAEVMLHGAPTKWSEEDTEKAIAMLKKLALPAVAAAGGEGLLALLKRFTDALPGEPERHLNALERRIFYSAASVVGVSGFSFGYDIGYGAGKYPDDASALRAAMDPDVWKGAAKVITACSNIRAADDNMRLAEKLVVDDDSTARALELQSIAQARKRLKLDDWVASCAKLMEQVRARSSIRAA